MKAILLVACAVCLGVGGDVFFKRSGGFPYVGFLLYALSGIPIWYSYRNGTWMQVSVLWQAMVVILTVAFGAAMFHEPLTMRRLAAFGLAFMAAWLAQ